MGGPARLVAMLAVAAATHAQGAVAAVADRFVPANPDFVVVSVRQSVPDETLRPLIAAWRADRAATSTSVVLAAAFIERARTLREPMYFGRAEAVLAPLVLKGGASSMARRLYAEVLQQRHDFNGAEALLDELLRDFPRDDDARLLRASVRLVRGNFQGARADCAQLATSGGEIAAPGFTCLAEALAGRGQLEQAKAVLGMVDESRAEVPVRAYLYATRAELHEREGDYASAVADYREAMKLAPHDDSIRAALADALAVTGNAAGARDVLAIDKPSLGLLVRSAALSEGESRTDFIARANAWLALEVARGDSPHYREAAMLALATGDSTLALTAARRNFEVQKELADVRVLARAARAAGDTAGLSMLRRWIRETGYRDSATTRILDERTRG